MSAAPGKIQKPDPKPIRGSYGAVAGNAAHGAGGKEPGEAKALEDSDGTPYSSVLVIIVSTRGLAAPGGPCAAGSSGNDGSGAAQRTQR